MKFESLITLFKNFFIKGLVLSLFCIAGETAAGTYTVTDAASQAGGGTLYWATQQANGDPGSTIAFSADLAVGTQIAPIDGYRTFTQDVTINGLVPANLSINANSPFDIGAGVKMTLIGNNNSTNNAVNCDVNIQNNGMLTFDQRETSRYTHIISGGGSLTLQVGAGQTLTFTSANTYTGGTNITSGTLATLCNNALPTTTSLNIASGTAFTIGNTFTQALAGLSGTGGLNLNGAFTLNSDTNDTFSGVATGTSDFNKGGIGTTTLSGQNTATGMLTINEGTIKIPTGGRWHGPVTIGATETLEMNGGTVTQPITGNAAATSVLNVTGNFTPSDTVNVATLNVKSGGTFTPNATVTKNIALNVENGGTLLLTNNILGGGGAVINAGTINHTANGTRTINGDFTQQGTGIINIGITAPGAGNYSQLNVTGNTVLEAGSVINIASSKTVIDKDEIFDIITSANIVGPLPTVPGSSLFLDFRPSIVNGDTTLRLTADRTPYQDVNVVPALEGVAEALDSLIEDNKFDPLLGFVDSITSPSEYTKVLEELAPTGLNGTYIAPGAGALDQALLRLEADRGMGTAGALARSGYTRTGYAAGDMMENQGSYGPIVFGNSTKQGSRNGLSGYNAVTGGFGFLGDVPILDYFRVGLGVSYANTAVKQSDNTGSNTTIGNTQGLAYGSATYGPLFLDGVLSVGMNNYHGKRNMPLFGQTATSAYNGFQYGAKVKTGFTIQPSQVEFSPMAVVQYIHLNIGRYTEKGAGLLNKNVDATKTSTVRVSLGGRIAETSQQEDFFPEIHAFYLVDVKNPDVLITSRFVAGGGSFVSRAAAPPKAGINVGASLTALIADDFAISGGYDLEAKKSFRSHSASLKFKFLF